jgi:hypothetical protein
MLKLSPSSPHQLTKKSSTELTAWMWPKMCGTLFEWLKKDRELLKGQLNRFMMYDDETPHEMFNWLKKLVNKTRALGSKKWTDRILMKRLMMVYTPMNYNIVTLIQ